MASKILLVFPDSAEFTETRQSGFAVLSFQLFYWSFISIASFILLNVVLAIIVEAYAVVKRKNMDVKSMGTDILEVRTKIFVRQSIDCKSMKVLKFLPCSDNWICWKTTL